ncbi:MAG: zinc transport system permease protein [Clostridia bacterium]|nr:zinc transport system permease protein [Clostridia bacterium]
MLEMLQFEFIRNALLGGLLASIACGIIGTYVVVKRIVFISGGISHCAYGGIGLGYFLGINPIIGAVLFSLSAALGIGIMSNKESQYEDTVIGVMWAIGMALGIIFVNLTPGYAPDLMSYLFGNVLTVPTSDIIIMGILDITIFTVVFLLYKEFLALCFDEEFTSIVGISPEILYLILLCLIALTVVLLIRVVGIILVIALLTIPAAISRMFTASLKKMMIMSVLLGVVFTTLGLWLSIVFKIPSGATIILTSGITYLICICYKHTFRQKFSSEHNLFKRKYRSIKESI